MSYGINKNEVKISAQFDKKKKKMLSFDLKWREKFLF